MPADTVMRYDMNGNEIGMEVRQQELNPDKLKKITIVQGWYLDPVTNKAIAKTNYVQLYIEKDFYTGKMFLVPFCRINY